MQQIIFEYNTQYGTFRDAIYLPDDHTLTDQEIDAMKQERLNNWLNQIVAMSQPVDPQEVV
jgi:hypothetical protein